MHQEVPLSLSFCDIAYLLRIHLILYAPNDMYEVPKLILQSIQTVAVIVGTVVGIFGYFKYRKEENWKKRAALAEEVLSQFYQCRDNLNAIRLPVVFPSEGKSRPKEENEKPEDDEFLNQSFVIRERYIRHKDSFSKLFALKTRFIVFFGKDAGKPFTMFESIVALVLSAGTMYPNSRRKVESGADLSNEAKSEMGVQKLIAFADRAGEDSISKAVSECISQIESCCESVLKPPK